MCEGKVRVAYSLSDVDSVIRKRQCCKCGHIFYTSEVEDDKAKYLFKQLQYEKEKRHKIQKFKKGLVNKK
jgi:transcriptional regulator NrdR family protein